jgi:hypothetical protein
MALQVNDPYSFIMNKHTTCYAYIGRKGYPITNMANYAMNNIPYYNKITEIPRNHTGVALDTSTAQNWSNAFSGCYNISTFPDPFYNMASATNMHYTFEDCSNLVNAPVIPNSITDMTGTFHNCSSLVNAPVIPNSVTDMYHTFGSCSSLVNAPVIPNSVTNMSGTFRYCRKLVNAPVIPNSVTDMGGTFEYCPNLVNAPVIPNSVTNMEGTFASCSKFTKVPNIPAKVTNMSYTFFHCPNIQGNIYINARNITCASYCFDGCSTYKKNIYVYKSTKTYNAFYKAMGNSTTNTRWNATLKTR